MLLFYGAITRARQHLVLSYPAVNGAGQLLFPSPYVTAVRELFEPGALEIIPVGGLDPVPRSDHILTASDVRVFATSQVHRRQPGLFRALCDDPETAETGRNILASAEAGRHRFHTRGFTFYEGRLADAENIRRIARRFSSQYEFSATELERYASCPFKFFSSHLLSIEPLESPESTTDYRERGLVVHNILAVLHREMVEQEPMPDGWSRGQIASRLCELIHAKLARRTGESDLRTALTLVETQILDEWAEQYAAQLIEYRERFAEVWETWPEPAQIELPFGDVPPDSDVAAESSFDSLALGTGPGRTLVQGRVDRIDVGTFEGRTVFNVIDYKTGKPRRFSLEDIRSGTAIQLALYAFAASRLGFCGAQAVPFQMGFWSLAETGFIAGLRDRRRQSAAPSPLASDVWQSLEESIDELVPRLAAGIRTGSFPVYNDDENCMRLCPYNTICRVRQIRPLRDKLEKYIDV